MMTWSQPTLPRPITRTLEQDTSKDIEACPHDELSAALAQPNYLFSGEKELFLAANTELLEQLKDRVMPLEQIAAEVFQAMGKIGDLMRDPQTKLEKGQTNWVPV